MKEYIPTIGLEIHVELKTQTKMFYNSKNDPDETRPNWNICPVCMGHPGTLPVINKTAVGHVLKVGTAVGGELADYTEFDRKNYFYPDIPKGYQITQYAYPLVKGGELAGVKLTRIHLEEDTALSKHLPAEASAQAGEGGHSLVDFNRAGIPLMEMVTEPVLHSSKDAVRFAKELQLLLRYLGVSDADMEKGHLRLEANISISTTDELGTKVEVKNLNSFRALERAIEYEIKRHGEVLSEGGTIEQETRGWDENKQATFTQRKKEYSHDYRYFPEPDLPKLKISEITEFAKDVLQQSLPELPWSRRERYITAGFKKEDADMFVGSPKFGAFVDSFLEIAPDQKSIAMAGNIITTNLAAMTDDPAMVKLSPQGLHQLVSLRMSNTISSTATASILTILAEEGGDPETIAKEKGLLQQSDTGALEEIIKKVIEENPAVVEEYKAGKESVIQFLVGLGMKASRGAANPQMLSELFKKHLI